MPVERLDLASLGTLTFEAPDLKKFPALSLAFETLDLGAAAGAVLNAAKEAALDAFLENRIGFVDMARLVGETLHALGAEASTIVANDGLEPIFDLDKRARDHVIAQIRGEKAPAPNLAG